MSGGSVGDVHDDEQGAWGSVGTTRARHHPGPGRNDGGEGGGKVLAMTGTPVRGHRHARRGLGGDELFIYKFFLLITYIYWRRRATA